MDSVLIILLCAAAALLHGLCGIGFPMVATAVLATFLPFKTAVVVVWLPTLLVNLVSVLSGQSLRSILRRYGLLAIGSFTGSLLGASLLYIVPAAWLQWLLGIMILAYVALSLRQQQWHIADTQANALGFGVLAGLVGGATNAMSPLLMMYLLAGTRTQNETAQAANLCFLIGKIAQLLVLGTQFLLLTQAEIMLTGWITLLSLSALFFGIKMRQRLSPYAFRIMVLAILCVLAVKSLISAGQAMWA